MQVLLINCVLKYVKMSVFAVFEWQSENFVVSLRDIFFYLSHITLKNE